MTVRTTEVLVHSNFGIPLRVIERPALHVIGDHLWHASLAMAYFVTSIYAPNSATALHLELGAGCGLVSLALARRLPESAQILATDIPEIVDQTLQETISANPKMQPRIHKDVLKWGSPFQELPRLVRDHTGPITVFASDVLYNAESHQDFLATIELLFKHSGPGASAFIAYKARVDGDERWFGLARNAGLRLELLLQLADIQVWQCLPGHDAA